MFISSLNFGLIIFILGFLGFLFLAPNLLNFIIMCEIIWISLYFYGVIIGAGGDTLLLFIWGLFFLCLATGESVIGLSLLVFKFAVEGTIRKFYGASSERQNTGKGYSRFWNTRL